MREFRQRKGWTQQELAYMSGVAIGTVARLETGRTSGNRLIRQAISQALGQSLQLVFPGPQKKAGRPPKVAAR